MSNFINRLLSFVGFEQQEGDEEDFLTPSTSSSSNNKESELGYIGGKKGKIVNINATAQLKLVVMQPENFEEARDIAEHLKAKSPVVINLECVEREVARRIIDFLSGSVYAVDGNIQKVSNGIFLVTPYNVGVISDFKDELRNKGIFPWNFS